MRTNYKRKTGFLALPLRTTKWKLSLALSAFAFLFAYQLINWLSTHSSEHQITLNLALPKRETPSPLSSDTTSLLPEWQTFTVKAGDNLGAYFQQAGVESKALSEILSLHDAQQTIRRIYPGQILKIRANSQGKLMAFQFEIDPLTTWVVQRKNGILSSKIEEKPIEKRLAFGGERIFDSFFVAGKQAKLDDALIMELANVFAYDIDFAQDIKPNDHFKVLFEEYFVNGVKVGNGPIIAAEFVNNGKRYQAIRYTDSTGQASYYAPNGQSLKKAFIRTPVQFTRVSSPFNLQRRHPILHKIRAHRGVDYAAPHGTPVKAAGQGKVIFVGKKGGYGNTVVLQHGTRYSTLYAHLSRFNRLKVGSSVQQGQIIGFVGSTGLASGPHLHYEFRIDGVHHNPLTVPLPKADGISGKAKSGFANYANNLLRLMNKHEKTLLAANE